MDWVGSREAGLGFDESEDTLEKAERWRRGACLRLMLLEIWTYWMEHLLLLVSFYAIELRLGVIDLPPQGESPPSSKSMIVDCGEGWSWKLWRAVRLSS
jgi:hypothetical protein